MEWSWRTVVILIGLLGMVVILIDGFRRMKRARAEALRLNIPSGGHHLPEDDFNPELPSKARVIGHVADRDEDDSLAVLMSGKDDDLADIPADAVSFSALDNAKPSIKSPQKPPQPLKPSTLANYNKPKTTSTFAKHKESHPASHKPVEIPNSPLIPKARRVNLDEQVPVLLDVEELGSDDAFADGILSAPRVVGEMPEKEKERVSQSKVDATIQDAQEATAKVESPQVEDPTRVNDPHLEDEVESLLPENTISQPVNFAGPNAEVLANRPDAELVLVIHTIARDPEGFAGKDLLFLFNSCDLRYGEKNIFHRFEDADGQGNIQFSVAQSHEPGVFSPSKMAEQMFTGLSFFMSLPGAKRPLEAYEAMSEMAMVVSRNLKADVLDGTHSAMTSQTREHERQQILDYERQQRLREKKERR
jgi:cell division protein ZipA